MCGLNRVFISKLFTAFALSLFCLFSTFTLAQAEIKDISATEALAMASEASSNIVILDVRTPAEFENGHADNAINIDFYNENFADHVAQLPKDKTYVVYCRTGVRAGNAQAIMQEQGFENVYNVDGGYHAMFPDKTYDMPLK